MSFNCRRCNENISSRVICTRKSCESNRREIGCHHENCCHAFGKLAMNGARCVTCNDRLTAEDLQNNCIDCHKRDHCGSRKCCPSPDDSEEGKNDVADTGKDKIIADLKRQLEDISTENKKLKSENAKLNSKIQQIKNIVNSP